MYESFVEDINRRNVINLAEVKENVFMTSDGIVTIAIDFNHYHPLVLITMSDKYGDNKVHYKNIKLLDICEVIDEFLTIYRKQ